MSASNCSASASTCGDSPRRPLNCVYCGIRAAHASNPASQSASVLNSDDRSQVSCDFTFDRGGSTCEAGCFGEDRFTDLVAVGRRAGGLRLSLVLAMQNGITRI